MGIVSTIKSIANNLNTTFNSKFGTVPGKKAQAVLPTHKLHHSPDPFGKWAKKKGWRRGWLTGKHGQDCRDYHYGSKEVWTDIIPADHVNREARRAAAKAKRIRCTRNPKFHAKRSNPGNQYNAATQALVADKAWQFAAQQDRLTGTAWARI